MTSSSSNGASLAFKTKDGVKFGKELREKEFLFDKKFLNLNHGVYIFFQMILHLLGRRKSLAFPRCYDRTGNISLLITLYIVCLIFQVDASFFSKQNHFTGVLQCLI